MERVRHGEFKVIARQGHVRDCLFDAHAALEVVDDADYFIAAASVVQMLSDGIGASEQLLRRCLVDHRGYTSKGEDAVFYKREAAAIARRSSAPGP
jgi:hypothetical protein